ncbi:MAG: NirD/YgiW/YdeI family stress tolerance protein [Treponema sp.]|jgi:uncharacterized protein (TIGR00156 family)|nr:NirD/YgiW/YdeI family stress tolerance protein [Treponema sp.]
MKKSYLIGIACFGLLLLPAYGQEGFTGPGSNSVQGGFTGPVNQYQGITVQDAQNLYDDARVVLQGFIIRAVGKEEYIFQDGTGEITVEIERKHWRGLSINETDRIEIRGKVDKERSRTKIEVKSITVLIR